MARILLIDDDESFRTMLSATLSYFGHGVIQACNGRQGLKMLAQAGADLVITDILMPEKEGIEVLMELRERRPVVKIIAMSGAGGDRAAGYLDIAKMFGASAVLSKPFSHAALLSALETCLSRPDGVTPPPE